MKIALVGAGAIVAASVVASLAACGSAPPPPATDTVTPGGSKDPNSWPADDRSMCDWKNKPDLDVSETSGPGALKPNIRRVYKDFGEGDNRHKTLICREIDTNLDGIKDQVRTFNEKGEALHEEDDTDYNGKVDVWISFVLGRLSEEDLDTNKDGKPDVWKAYVDGQLSRIKRDRNFDGRPDVWEIYTKGKLERMGIDDTYDGHVDRWERDDEMRAQEDAADRKADTSTDGGAPVAAPGMDAFVDGGALGTADSAGPDAGAPRVGKPKRTTKR